MKATALILIFSGLMGLNRCSSEIKIDFPIILNKNGLKTREIKTENDYYRNFLLFSQAIISNYPQEK